MTSLDKRLREARERMGFSQVNLAGLAGVSLPTIQNIEAGKGNPSLEVLERLSKPLGLRIELEIVPADWECLAACGVPLSSSMKNEYVPTPDVLCAQLKLACTELQEADKRDPEQARKTKAIQATILAIASRYPTFYKENLEKSLVQSFYPKVFTGAHIKLRRIAMDLLCQYL